MTAQLDLLAPPYTPPVPLRDALLLVATQWTQRLGVEVRVVEYVNGGGYRLEREPKTTSDADREPNDNAATFGTPT